MISSLCWVPKGAAREIPLQNEGNEMEIVEEDASKAVEEEMPGVEKKKKESQVEVAKEAARSLARTKKSKAKNDDIMAELEMDKYDEDEGDDGLQLFGNGGLGATYHRNPTEDPFLSIQDDADDEEKDDLKIRPTDLLILTARNEDDVSHIEMWVCEESDPAEGSEVNLYVHHDILLPAFPLCLAWMDCSIRSGASPTDKANLVAVGTMEPGIEIWDLDVLDSVEPLSVLGGLVAGSSPQKKSKKVSSSKVLAPGSHSDAVLGLAWNTEFRNVLASGSADKTVKVWDVATGSCQHTMTHHTGKVQAVAWNPREAPVLLSGSFDKTCAVVDMRAPDQQSSLRWSLSADVECLAWNPHAESNFLVSTEDGLVCSFDARMAPSSPDSSSALFTLHAHDKATCALSFNPSMPHLLATASTDKTVKLWSTASNQPSCLASSNPKVGAVFTLAFCRDSPYLLAVGGSKGNLHVWNTAENSEVSRRFQVASV